VHATLRDGALVLAGDVHDRSLQQRLLAHVKERTDLPLVDEVTALPHPALGERRFGVVSLSVANLRRRPGHAEELVSQALLGTPLRLLKQQGGWAYVQTPDDYLGWMIDSIGAPTELGSSPGRGGPG